MSRITATFNHLRQAGRTALMPYLTMGYPERESALALVPILVEAGADLIELRAGFLGKLRQLLPGGRGPRCTPVPGSDGHVDPARQPDVACFVSLRGSLQLGRGGERLLQKLLLAGNHRRTGCGRPLLGGRGGGEVAGRRRPIGC